MKTFFDDQLEFITKLKYFFFFFQKLYAYIKLTLADNQSECIGKSMKLTIEWSDINGLVLLATYKGPTLSCRGYLHRSHWIPPQLKRENRKKCAHKLNSITLGMYSQNLVNLLYILQFLYDRPVLLIYLFAYIYSVGHICTSYMYIIYQSSGFS